MSIETETVVGSDAGHLPLFTLDTEPGYFAGRVALLTNFLPPYRVRMLEMLASGLSQFRAFLSVRMEVNRDWQADWGTLDVKVQRNISFSRIFGNAKTYRERSLIHLPWDTIPQLMSYAPDVVISAEFGMRTLQAAVYSFLFRKPLIVWATLSEVTERNRGRVRHALRHVLLHFVDRVLVNGSSGSRYIAGFGFPKERIHIVPQASNNEAFAGPATRSQGEVTQVLYVGQLIERKGLRYMHEALLRWCASHPTRRVRWSIIGSGPLRATMELWQRLENYELDFHESMPFEVIATQYHAADVFAFPTLADEWGLVVNEAMIAGLPVLGSVYSQAVLDAVVDGVSGWTFRPNCPEEIDRALDRAMASSAEQLNAMRRAAIKTMMPLDQRNMCNRILLAIGDAAPALIRARRLAAEDIA